MLAPTTLNEALSAVRGNRGAGPQNCVFLACGFQPLHLSTFLQACAARYRPSQEAIVATGVYGDLEGNLARAAESDALAAAVVIEWGDLDPRLGLRSTGGWGTTSKQDIVATVQQRSQRLVNLIRKTGERMPVAVAGPTLELPPLGSTMPGQASALELQLQAAAASFLLDLADAPGVRIVHPARIAETSPETRLDPKMELMAGFPYTVRHASALAGCLAEVLWPPAPRKGLITDLDDTLWAGIVGEVGSASVCWTQDNHAQTHGLYQQMLGHLADCGVLLAVTSKNELSVVQEALARQDLLFSANTLFPIVANWGAKSANIAEVLRVWNIGPADVVFVDDNPMELSEVQKAFPDITCLQFQSGDAASVWSLLKQLRALFGKPVLLEEDRIRRDSIRASAAVRESGEEAGSPEFLRTLQGRITIDYSLTAADKRALELVNKTNQFNLNGIRVSEGEWQKHLSHPSTIAASISYQDKFGPLGKIAVLTGKMSGSSKLEITHWVMSCRAFSRRIEHHALHSIIQKSGASEVEFDYRQTERNQPLQEFFKAIKADSGRLRADRFMEVCGELPHETSEVVPA